MKNFVFYAKMLDCNQTINFKQSVICSQTKYLKKTFFKKNTLWPLFMDGVQLPQG